MDNTQPTQPATQQVLDPRRVGRNNSGLSERDISDVIAILHPGSPSAIKIVANMIETRSHHVLQRNSYDSYNDGFSDIEEQETIIINRSDNQSTNISRSGADLALRLSSVGLLKNPSSGFIFGRNAGSSDIVFGQDAGKRVSNKHFRIYLNSDAIPMIEDMSTNGTAVDDVLLKSRDPRYSKVRMLSTTSTSIITIPTGNDGESIRFFVRIPSRSNYQERYDKNVREFFRHVLPEADRARVISQLKRQHGAPMMKWDGGERYNIIGVIGKGAFATVHQLATKMEGKLLAAKELERRRFVKNGQLDKKVDNEMKIMQGLRHPNIVEFVEYHDQGDYLYIIMEYVRHGDLQHYLHKNGPMEETIAKSMARQIFSALSYLHRMKVIHRDIKPDNILISDLDPFTVKISDFGLSKNVTRDETFLRTFCGTLLYCAPEVFPDHVTASAKGVKRRRGEKPKEHLYSSLVDIWSFAAVLWFALCGKPPFEGIADATGQAMYRNIMTTPLDPTPLEQAGVSASGIDLLCKMLQTDPSLRPTERECLLHPWLKDDTALPEDPVLQSIVEEDECEETGEHFSQLAIDEEVPDSDEEIDDSMLEDDEFERLIGNRESKRVRVDPLFPRNQLRDREQNSSITHSFHSRHDIDDEESFQVVHKPATRPRLFGEIGQSALQSSGILNDHANEALSHEVSNGVAVVENDRPPAKEHRHESPILQGIPQLDGVFSSPSLLGAESMVRDLNMASPHSPISNSHSPNEPATPKTPEVHQHSSLGHSNQHPSQISDATPKAKPPTLNRQISLPKTASFFYNPWDETTHTLEYASKVSGFDFVGAAQTAKASETELDDTIRNSVQNGHSSGGEESASAASGIDLIPPPELGIKAPPRRLGKLTATADSFIPGLTLPIQESRTSWGRLRKNTIVYEDGADTRVPKTAFNIFWWSTSADVQATLKELSQQGKDWTTLDNLHVGIFTCASSGISVNGKHIRQTDEKGRALYGVLHTGDVIQVYHGSKGNSECLKFVCEFYHGSGKEPRPSGQTFTIQQAGKLLLDTSA